jgi:hypothetical protein
MATKEELRKKKKAILDKYFPKMGVSECDFDVDTGKCRKCNTFFADAKMRLCSVISPDEITIRDDEHLWN